MAAPARRAGPGGHRQPGTHHRRDARIGRVLFNVRMSNPVIAAQALGPRRTLRLSSGTARRDLTAPQIRRAGARRPSTSSSAASARPSARGWPARSICTQEQLVDQLTRDSRRVGRSRPLLRLACRYRTPAICRCLRLCLRIRIGEFFDPAGEFERDAVGVVEVERPHVDARVQRSADTCAALSSWLSTGPTRTPLSFSRCRYSSNFSAGTWNARWFIELTALAISPIPGIAAGEEMPGTRSAASANQKKATQSPFPASKKKCWPIPPGRSSDLINGIPEHAGVEVDGLAHIRAHQRDMVDAAELEFGIGIVGLDHVGKLLTRFCF